MNIKKTLLFCLTAALTFSAAACGSDDTKNTESLVIETTDTVDAANASPLSDMEYPDLAISKKTDFDEIIITLIQDYIDAANSYTTYCEDHYDELALGKPIYSISGYQDSFECWYQLFYKINSYGEENVPDEYKSIWEHFKNMASHNKPLIDEIYTSNIIGLMDIMDEVMEYDMNEIEAIQEEYAALS